MDRRCSDADLAITVQSWKQKTREDWPKVARWAVPDGVDCQSVGLSDHRLDQLLTHIDREPGNTDRYRCSHLQRGLVVKVRLDEKTLS